MCAMKVTNVTMEQQMLNRVGVICAFGCSVWVEMAARGVLGRAHNLLEELLVIIFGIYRDQPLKQI